MHCTLPANLIWVKVSRCVESPKLLKYLTNNSKKTKDIGEIHNVFNLPKSVLIFNILNNVLFSTRIE